MINIFCTKKLETFFVNVSKNIEIHETENNWNGQLLNIKGQKCLLFIDKKTLYLFLISNFSKKNLPKIKELFFLEFFNQLKRDGIYSLEVKNYFIDVFDDIKFFKTDNDQKTLGSIKNCEALISRFCRDFIDIENAITYYQNERMNLNPIGVRNFITSKELLIKELKLKGLIT